MKNKELVNLVKENKDKFFVVAYECVKGNEKVELWNTMEDDNKIVVILHDGNFKGTFIHYGSNEVMLEGVNVFDDEIKEETTIEATSNKEANNKPLTKAQQHRVKDRLIYLMSCFERINNECFNSAIEDRIKELPIMTMDFAIDTIYTFSVLFNQKAKEYDGNKEVHLVNIDREYIENVIIKNITYYTCIEIRSFDNSTNKRRNIVNTLFVKEGMTRKDLIAYATNWLNENNIVLKDKRFELYL